MCKTHNRIYSLSKLILFAIVSVFLCNGLFALQCQAGEGEKIGWHGPYPYKPPVFGFNEKYENAKIVKRYDKANADEVKGLVPDVMIEWLKDTEKWGPFYINEMEYIKYEPPAGYKAASKKHAGTCKVAKDGQLLNWVAGLPFLEPKTGYEIAWNFEKRYRSDDYEHPYISAVTDKKGKVKHYLRGAWRRLYLVGRTEVDPKPVYPNEKGLELVDSFGYTDPYHMRGIIPLYMRYEDQLKADEMWMYIPTMRRTRRMSTAQRMDTLGGGFEATWDDFQNMSGKIMQYDWKLIGRKEALLPTMAKGKPEWVEGKHLTGVDDRYRRVNAYIIECIPKDPNHIYSKKVMWVDPESWHMPYGAYYDRNGDLWKVMHFHIAFDAKGNFYPVTMTLIDIKRMHSSNTMIFGSSGNNGWTPDMWSWSNLKTIYPAR
jgi:uncharacterized protein DUF1329